MNKKQWKQFRHNMRVSFHYEEYGDFIPIFREWDKCRQKGYVFFRKDALLSLIKNAKEKGYDFRAIIKHWLRMGYTYY